MASLFKDPRSSIYVVQFYDPFRKPVQRRVSTAEAVDAPRALSTRRTDGAAGLAARIDGEARRVDQYGAETAAGDAKRDNGGGHAEAGG